MRASIPLLVLVGGACSASRPATIERPPSAPAAFIPTGSTTEVRLARDDRAVEDVIQASSDATWAATRAFYLSLRVPLSMDDARKGIIATASFNVPRRFLDQPLSSFLDCGQSLAGTRVHFWAVRMELTTAVRPEPGGHTRVGTLVTAHARSRDGTSVPPVPCSSTGKLENEVARRIRAGVGL